MKAAGVNVVPIAAAALGASALLTATAGTASAWPIPITGEQQNFINQARGAGFPGDDDQVVTAGLQACRLLYTGQGAAGVSAALSAQYGSSQGQAAGLVSAAHATMCTQAPS